MFAFWYPQSPVKNLNFRFRTIFIFGVLSLGLFSALFYDLEKREITERLQSYVLLWEKDLVALSLRGQKESLLPKIQEQIINQHPALEHLTLEIGPHFAELGSAKCQIQLTPIPVYLNGIKAGGITACASLEKTMLSAWTRPWSLMVILLLCFGLFSWEIRSSRERLRNLKKDLEIKGLAEKNLLARQVAHDLRGPLTALQTIVLSKAISESYAELAQDVIHRIHSISHELLKSQKKSTETQELNGAASSKQKTLKELMLTLAKEFQLRDSNCEVRVTAREDVLIHNLNLNVIDVSRILSNIMQNSLEARKTPEARVVLDVIMRLSQNMLVLSIKDNGKGIPEDIQPLIFSEGASFGKDKGYGLGLFSAQKLLRSRGGDIQLSSLLDVGTEVTLMIPLSLAEDNKTQLVL